MKEMGRQVEEDGGGHYAARKDARFRMEVDEARSVGEKEEVYGYSKSVFVTRLLFAGYAAACGEEGKS